MPRTAEPRSTITPLSGLCAPSPLDARLPLAGLTQADTRLPRSFLIGSATLNGITLMPYPSIAWRVVALELRGGDEDSGRLSFDMTVMPSRGSRPDAYARTGFAHGEIFKAVRPEPVEG